jgi:hypothetical protein
MGRCRHPGILGYQASQLDLSFTLGAFEALIANLTLAGGWVATEVEFQFP